jgi:malate dehydrogenase
MKKVSIVGGGNVGTNTAFFLAENGTASVTLVDVKEGVPVGKALDLMEAGPLRGYDTTIRGANAIAEIEGSDVVVIAAGRVRKPGEQRIDLYLDNAQVVRGICADVRKYAPNAVVVNVVEPVDSMTLVAQEALGFDRKRVLGVGGLLSSTRLRYAVAHALDISPREITALVVGPHRQSMVVLRDSIRVAGIPAVYLLGADRIETLIEEVRTAGDTILQMAQHSTAYYAPSAAAQKLIEAICRDTHEVLPITFRLEGEYDVRGLAVSVPAQIGLSGVEKVLPAPMSAQEKQAFAAAAQELRAAIDSAQKRESA